MVIHCILKGKKREKKVPLEAELVFGEVVDEIDLIVRRGRKRVAATATPMGSWASGTPFGGSE